MFLPQLSWKSLCHRKVTVLLTLVSIAMSVTLLLLVEQIRKDARSSFSAAISGTDLIVGGRTGSVPLLLFSVFHLGNPSNNIGWTTYERIRALPGVKWGIPVSLGDSHKGYRVIGTTTDYFRYFQYGKKQSLAFKEGAAFAGVFELVLGAEVAAKLGYRLGDSIVLSHGAGAVSFAEHSDMPFRVVGILEPTATPVDRSVLVSLQGIEAIHLGWQSGAAKPADVTADDLTMASPRLQPTAITAFYLGLDTRLATFRLQRQINDYRGEPLQAVLPGVALQELWQLVGLAESALLLVTLCVAFTGLLGLLTVLWSGLNERRREMAILRSVGARPLHVFVLLIMESAFITLISLLVGVALFYFILWLLAPVLARDFGFYLTLGGLYESQWYMLLAFSAVGLMVGMIPAWRAYRNSLADGLTVRL